MINALLQESPIVINKNDWAFFVSDTLSLIYKFKKTFRCLTHLSKRYKKYRMKFLIIVLAIHIGIKIIFNKVKAMK
jgi:hypothetical protein